VSFPRTLVFTPTPPGEGSVGEHYISELLKAMPGDQLCCYAAWPSDYGDWIPSAELQNLAIEFTTLDREPFNSSKFGALVGNMHSCLKRRAYWRALRPVIDEVIEFGLAHQTELFYAVINGPSSVRMTRKISRKLPSRLIVHVTDLPQKYMRLYGYDIASRISVSRYFKDLLKNAEHVLVSSEDLKDQLQARYNIQATLIPHPTDLSRDIAKSRLFKALGVRKTLQPV
jgi:hypothetical protein